MDEDNEGDTDDMDVDIAENDMINAMFIVEHPETITAGIEMDEISDDEMRKNIHTGI